jgi:hypothetical protein
MSNTKYVHQFFLEKLFFQSYILEYKGSIFLLSQSFSRFPGMKMKKLEKIPTPDDRSMVKGI